MFKANRNIDDLEPRMAERVKKFVKLCEKRRIDVLITETRRTVGRQRYLYAIGRWGENKTASPVTWTLQSKHIEGDAIDIVPLSMGLPNWSAIDYVWQEIYDLAYEVGLKSLFRETEYDRPHLEYDPLWTPETQKEIKNNEKILSKKMDKAWKALDDANSVKKYLADLKGVEYKKYEII